jgi:high-affinity nickel permease
MRVPPGDLSSSKKATAPPDFEMPLLQLLYTITMMTCISFFWALTISNIAMYILIDVYSTLRWQFQRKVATASDDNLEFKVRAHWRPTFAAPCMN